MTKADDYRILDVEVDDGIAEIRIVTPGYSLRGHWEWSQVWRVIEDDPEVRVGMIVWAIPDDLEVEAMPAAPPQGLSSADHFGLVMQMGKEARAAVYGVIETDKPIVSAIKGRIRTGAGLAASLLADISVASETVLLSERHIAMGVAAGDHAALWPLLCGMAKAKRYLLTSESLDGKEAERIGLVSIAVPEADVYKVAREYAVGMANGPQNALRFTKRSLNQWWRLGAVTAFEHSLALELSNFFDGDHDALADAMRKGDTSVRFPSIDVRVPIPE